MKGVKKEHLPEKICKACGRPFSWRKKWERCWDEVQYCSEGCKKQKPKKLLLFIDSAMNHRAIFLIFYSHLFFDDCI